jgi:uncharacterized repeat protein (TIGR02543 family)
MRLPSTVNLNGNAFTVDCKIFKGWSTTSGGTVEYGDRAPYTMGTSDAKLYAQWGDAPIHVTPEAGSSIDFGCEHPPSITVNVVPDCAVSYEWHTIWMGLDIICTETNGYSGTNTATLSGALGNSDAQFYCKVTDHTGTQITSGLWIYHFCQ